MKAALSGSIGSVAPESAHPLLSVRMTADASPSLSRNDAEANFERTEESGSVGRLGEARLAPMLWAETRQQLEARDGTG